MSPDAPAPRISVGTGPDGTLTYLVEVPPEALPCVLGRDLAAAWDAAREAAAAARWGVARGFRFRRSDGTFLDMALADRDARSWAGGVDRVADMHTSYGLSLCLRLLALVDLLARAPWARGLFNLRAGAAELDPSVLRAAAAMPLTPDARFDEPGFRARTNRLPAPRADPMADPATPPPAGATA